MSEWRNIAVPSEEIEDVEYFVYRRGGRVIKNIALKTSRGTIFLNSQRARRQFLNHLGLPFLGTERIYDYRERNRVVKEALEKRSHLERSGRASKLLFRCREHPRFGLQAWSVVTEEYVEISVPEARNMAFNILEKVVGGYKLEYSWDSGTAWYYKVLLYQDDRPLKVGDIAYCGLVFKIGYSGDRALAVYPYWKILSCLNGLMSHHSIQIYRGIHRGDKEKILRRFRYAIYEALDKLMELAPIIDKARSPISEAEERAMLEKVLRKYPQHIQGKIWHLLCSKYRDETGVFKLSQALSDVASHGIGITDRYAQELSKDAYRLIASGVRTTQGG